MAAPDRPQARDAYEAPEIRTIASTDSTRGATTIDFDSKGSITFDDSQP